MITRRVPALVGLIVALVAIAVVGRSTPVATTPAFAPVTADWMPAVASASGLTSTWFCPGVPASGDEGVGGEVVVSNGGETPLTARVALLVERDDEATETTESITVPPRDRVVVDVGALVEAPFASAVVEIDGGGGVVEQRAVHPAGSSVAPCTTSTSPSWYLADGFTVDGSRNQIVLTNPFDDPVIVDVGFATGEGSRTPAAYQGFPIAPRSVEVIDFGVAGAGAQGEELLAVKVEASRGGLIVGRSQHFLGGGRLGYSMTLAAPALRDQWWFADGEKGAGIAERYSLYNPTERDVEVDVVFLGISELAEVEPILVPARQVVAFDPATVSTLVEGRHATVFATRSEPSIVVDRALTRTVDGRPVTSVLAGAPPRPDGYVPSIWYLAIGPDAPTEDALVVFNVDNTPGTLTVEAVGPDGLTALPGLEQIEIPSASVVALDLGPEAVGRQLVISSSARIFVERSLPIGLSAARSSSWALPAT